LSFSFILSSRAIAASLSGGSTLSMLNKSYFPSP
jgi:hypothetical protein